MTRSEGEKGEGSPFSPFPPAGDPRRSGFSFWYFFFCEVVI